MLSRIDIENELGKGINIVPFKEENLKENSINLSASSYAWAMTSGQCYVNETNELTTEKLDKKLKTLEVKEGETAVKEIGGEQIIVILPMSTVLIETEEVLAVDKNIGGTYHSKIAIASIGIGHIGTMLGPNFSGHSLVAVHNVSQKPLKIRVGQTFVSVVFNYLATSVNFDNATYNGHLDKMAELGVKLTSNERVELGKDWKNSVKTVREKMVNDNSYKEYKKLINRRKFDSLLKLFSLHNVIILCVIGLAFYCIYRVAMYLDRDLSEKVWVDRFWTVGFSGIFIYVTQVINTLLKK